MPFINSKVTVKMSDEKKDAIKAKLGQAAAIIGKPESYLMVGFEDEYCLYFADSPILYVECITHLELLAICTYI